MNEIDIQKASQKRTGASKMLRQGVSGNRTIVTDNDKPAIKTLEHDYHDGNGLAHNLSADR